MKKDIVRKIAFYMGEKTTQKDADTALQAVVAAIRDELVINRVVRISGLGTFKVKVRKARKARNPRTGEMVQVPEKSVLTFKADSCGQKTATAAKYVAKFATEEVNA